MKSNKVFIAVCALAMLSGATLAQARTASLAPAGQGPIDEPLTRSSTLTRDQVRSQLAQARFRGELIAAGEGPIGDRPATTSVLTRAEVKAETLQARNEGALVPAGEGPVGGSAVASDGTARTAVAFHRGEAVRTH